MQWQLRMVLVAAVAARAQQRFLTEPGDVTVIAGQRVGLYCIMFQCSVELQVVLPCVLADQAGLLQWTRDGFGLGTNRSLPGFPRYNY